MLLVYQNDVDFRGNLPVTLDAAVTITHSVTVPTIRLRCLVCGERFMAFRRSAKTCSVACRQAISRGLRAATPPLSPGPFDLIYAAPPWHFAPFSDKGQGRSPSPHYMTMQLDAISGLPILDTA